METQVDLRSRRGITIDVASESGGGTRTWINSSPPPHSRTASEGSGGDVLTAFPRPISCPKTLRLGPTDAIRPRLRLEDWAFCNERVAEGESAGISARGASNMLDFLGMQSATNRTVSRLAGGSWIILLVVCPVVSWVLLIYVLIFSRFYWLALLYLAWMWVDRHTPFRGGRRLNWFRKLGWWRKAAEYFPVQMVKTAELPPGKNYLLATFPHGVLCHGGFLSLCTESVDVSERFPGLTIIPFTLDLNFYMPLVRDVLMALGFCSVSSASLGHFLGDTRGSNALCLVVGGAAEALCSDPGTYLMVANRRKGFVKLALRHGVQLVPVLVLGETDLYDQVRGPWLRRLQEKAKELTSVAPVLMNGCGLFQDRFGLIPRQKPLTVLVGRPIDVETVEEPTMDQVNRLHAEFIRQLVELFEDHKHKYIADADNTRITFA